MGKTATEAQQTSARRSRVNLCLVFQAEKSDCRCQDYDD